MKYLSLKIFAILIILQFNFKTYGSPRDSLQNLLKTELPDTTRIDVLGKLSLQLIGIHLDSTIYYAQKAVDLAVKIDDKERKAYMLKNIGIGHYYKGDFVSTLDAWFASLNAFRSIQHAKGESNMLGNIGSVYNSTGDYPKAIDYHLKCLRIAEESKDDFRRATALQNIGAVYSNMQDYTLSKKYYDEALAICRTLEYDKGIATIIMNLSEVHRNQSSLDTALIYAIEAKQIFEKLKDPSTAEALIGISHTYYLQGQYDKAIKEAKLAYDYVKNSGSEHFEQRALVALGNALLKKKLIQPAIDAYLKAIQLRQTIGTNIDVQEAYKGLKTAYETTKNYQKAFIAQDSLLKVTQQLYDIEKNDKIANLQLEFNLEKRETEIALLNADNALKSEAVAKATLQKNFFSAISVLLLSLIGAMGFLYQFAKRKNKVISAQKVESDRLLKNILPTETAEELKKNGKVQPKEYSYCTVLFTDFVNFTKASEEASPEVIVSSLDYYFKNFDEIIDQNNLEKIKTIGDAYMCAGGLRKGDENHHKITKNTLQAASEILQFVEATNVNTPPDIVSFDIRIGIDSGPILAGVVGKTKFQYDIWGDTVNVAARMETNSEPNKINVSENIFNGLKEQINFIYRGMIDVKNKGMMKMYYWEGGLSE